MDTKNFITAYNTFLDEKVSSLSTNYKITICAVTMIVPLVIFYFLIFSPKSTEIEQLHKSISSMEIELQSVKGKAAKINEQKALMTEMENKFKEAARVIPDNKEIPSLLTNISSQGTASGLDMLSFIPGTETPKEFYAEIPVTLSVQGTYHNLGYFLATVSKLPRIVNVSDISMGSPKIEEGEMILSSKVNLVTYKFIEPVPEEKDKKGKSGKKK
jgi:type IV pilus assembly protein PilO